MAVNRRAAQRDRNEGEIVKALRRQGIELQFLSMKGVCDLLVAGRHTLLIEVKAEDGEVNDDQLEFLFNWPGASGVARTPEEALELVGKSASRLAVGLELGFGTACRIAAALLALPENVELMSYVRARVAHIAQKGRRKAFSHPLLEGHAIALKNEIPRALGWHTADFWSLFERVVNKGWVVLMKDVTPAHAADIRLQWLRFTAAANSLQQAQLSFEGERNRLEDIYFSAELLDRYRPEEVSLP